MTVKDALDQLNALSADQQALPLVLYHAGQYVAVGSFYPRDVWEPGYKGSAIQVSAWSPPQASTPQPAEAKPQAKK